MSDDPDLRLYVSFRDSPKRLALCEVLGPAGIVALIDLWCWTRVHRPTGNLGGISNGAIEAAARWMGERGAFITALVPAWLEGTEGSYVVRGWDERQGWAKSSAARRQAGKVAAIVKQAVVNGVTTDQWLDDVGGEDARNEQLRERARQAYAKRAGRNARGTNRGTYRSGNSGDRSTIRSTMGNESLSLVSTPSPSPTPSPTGGGDGAGAAPSGSSAARPPGAAPLEVAAGSPRCALCAERATAGPGLPSAHLPCGLEQDLCPAHLTTWLEARDRPGTASRTHIPRTPLLPTRGRLQPEETEHGPA